MKKISKRLLSVLVLILVGVLIVSCGPDKKYTVTFDANGGNLNSDATVEVAEDKALTLPEAPSRDNYQFEGWFISDDNGETLLREWDFEESLVNADMTLYASWLKLGPDTITEVLNDGQDGDKVEIIGTVYFINSKGAYISDSELGKILVEHSNTEVEVGSLLEVEGELSVSNNEYKVVAETVNVSSGEEINSEDKALKEVVKLKNTDKTGSWYQYFNVVGTLQKEEALNTYRLVTGGGEYVVLNQEFGVSEFEANLEERVEMEVVLTGYDSISSLWEVDYVLGTMAEKLYTQTEIETALVDMFNNEIETEVLGGGLTLPSMHPLIKDLTITWETTAEEVEILEELNQNNKYDTIINVPEEDTNVTLTATIHYKEESTFTIDVVVSVLKLSKMTLEEAINTEANMAIFEGVVIGFAAGQTISFKSYIVQDLSNPDVYITVDYDRTGETHGSYIEDVAIGDILEFTAGYRDTGRPTFKELETKKTGRTQEPVYDFENAPVLNEDTWEGYDAEPNRFVKLENPYMRYSTSGVPSITNWIRLGYGPNDVGINYGPNNKSLAFLIRPVDELLGREWRDNLEITNAGEQGILYEGNIYGFTLYESSTYIQFVAVSEDHFKPSDKLTVIEELKELIPLNTETGNLTLPTTHELIDGNFTWTSSDETIIATDGTVNYPEVDETVTLTVSFKVLGSEENIDLSFDIYVVGAEKIVKQIDEVLTSSEDGETFYVEAIVLGAGYNTGGNLSDIFLQDKTSGNSIVVQGLTGFETEFNIGDLVEFMAEVEVNSNPESNEFGKKNLIYFSNLEVLEADKGILDYKTNAIEINSDEDTIRELNDENRKFGAVYFFNGTYFINATSSNGYENNNNLRFHMNENASGTNDIKYGLGKNLVINIPGNTPTLGENWNETVLGFNAENYPGISYPGLAFNNGGFYAVLKNASNSYYYWSILSAEDIISESEEQQIERELIEAILDDVVGGEIELPTTHEHVTGDITWVSANTDVISNTGVITVPQENITVVLTATYTYNGTVYELDIQVNVLALVTKTVEQVITNATDGEVVKVKGIVIGFHWNGSSSRDANSHGIMIKDALTNHLLYVVGLHDNYGTTYAEYVIGEGESAHTLAKGDEIEFSAEYDVSTIVGNLGRKTLIIETATAANMKVLRSNVEYQFDKTQAEAITSELEIENLTENIEYGKLYKLVGAFTLRSSSSTLSKSNMQPSFTGSSERDDYRRPVTWAEVNQSLTFNIDGNNSNLEDDWGETKLGLTTSTWTGVAPYTYSAESEIYFFVGNSNQMSNYGYIQLVILDMDWINATLAA